MCHEAEARTSQPNLPADPLCQARYRNRFDGQRCFSEMQRHSEIGNTPTPAKAMIKSVMRPRGEKFPIEYNLSSGMECLSFATAPRVPTQGEVKTVESDVCHFPLHLISLVQSNCPLCSHTSVIWGNSSCLRETQQGNQCTNFPAEECI